LITLATALVDQEELKWSLNMILARRGRLALFASEFSQLAAELFGSAALSVDDIARSARGTGLGGPRSVVLPSVLELDFVRLHLG
jgi:hypothetical protein